MKRVLFRLVASLTVVLGLWLLIWAPLAVGEAAAEGERVLGNPNAKVTIVEYASLTCPACARFHNETLPALKERYIATGEVRLIYRDFPLDQYALHAAAIAHCAGEDRYFSFLDVLFQNQDQWTRASDPLRALTQLARLGGLTQDRIDACLADEELVNGILQGMLEAQERHGVRSTPTFLVNGDAYVGHRSVEDFAAIIDPLLD